MTTEDLMQNLINKTTVAIREIYCDKSNDYGIIARYCSKKCV